jgi:DNA-binding response OmpR family regulator
MNEADRDRMPERGSTVLIVETERSVRSVTRRMLERCGFRTLVACDGDEALALFDDHLRGITGVVLELGLPGMDAEALFRALRSARPDLPILFTGGCGQGAAAARLVGAAGTDFLPKPFGLDSLGDKASQLFWGGRPAATTLAGSSTRIGETLV